MRMIERGYLYTTVFFSGAAVLVLEILGTRVVAPFYGSTIFVWTSLITVTLTALAAGYYFGGIIIDRNPKADFLFATVLVAGVLFLVPDKISQWVLVSTDSLGLRYGPLAAATILFGAPLVALGMIGPMAIRMLSEEKEHAGKNAGRVFAISTIGSIIGGLLVGFYLLPFFSLTQLLQFTGWILVIVALIGLAKFKAPHWDVAKVVLFVAGVVMLSPQYVYPDGNSSQILSHRQGYYGDLKVVEVAGTRCVTLNGVTESCRNTQNGSASLYFQEIANMIHQTNAKDVLVLGSGAGDLVEGGLIGVANYSLVDVDSGLVGLGKEYLDYPGRIADTTIISDARYFLRHTEKTYDLIFVDLATGANPPTHMFSHEAFSLLRSRLNNNGLVLIHILGGVGNLDASTASIIRTARSVFPVVHETATNPPENVSYLVHASIDPNYEISYDSIHGVRFVPVTVTHEEAVLLFDDKNYLDILFIDKYPVLVEATRNWGGYKTVFSL